MATSRSSGTRAKGTRTMNRASSTRVATAKGGGGGANKKSTLRGASAKGGIVRKATGRRLARDEE